MHLVFNLAKFLPAILRALPTFADDSQLRWVTAMTMLDYNTIAAGDCFGNVFVNRLDSKVSRQVDDDSTDVSAISHEIVF